MLVGALLAGAGAGGMDAGFNAAVALRNDARLMGLLHAGYGVGAAIGPVVAGVALASGAGWRPAYALFAAASLLLALALRGRAMGEAPPQVAMGSPRGLLLPCLTFFVYVSLEVTVGQWAFTSLTEHRGMGALAASVWVGVYWVGLTAGRFWLGITGHRVADRAPARPERGRASPAARCCCGWAVRSPRSGLLVAGLALSVVFPLLMLLTPERVGSERATAAVGWQAAAAGRGRRRRARAGRRDPRRGRHRGLRADHARDGGRAGRRRSRRCAGMPRARARPDRGRRVSDRPFPSGDAYQAHFDALAAQGHDVHGEAAFVLRLAPRSVLDAGCGTGRVAIELSRRGVEVVGVDVDAAMLATARSRAPDLAGWRRTWRRSTSAAPSTWSCSPATSCSSSTEGAQPAVVARSAAHLDARRAHSSPASPCAAAATASPTWTVTRPPPASPSRPATPPGTPTPGPPDADYALSVHRLTP